MYDYKFRQSDLSFNKPKRSPHKTAFLLAGLAGAVSAAYGIAHLDFPWQEQIRAEASGTGPDIIPLALPPYVEPAESTQPTDIDESRRTETPTDQAFMVAMKRLHGRGKTMSWANAVENRSLAGDELVQAATKIAAIESGGDIQPEPDADVDERETGTWIEHEVKPGDNLTKIFQDNNLSPQLLQNILRSSKEARHLKTIRPKDKLRIHLDREQQFAALHVQLDALRSVRFAATESGIESTKIRKQTEAMATVASGVINHTLFASASKAGLPDAITAQFAKIFGYDIDFALEIRPGDQFKVIYEELWAEGKQVGSGNVIAAELINNGRTHRAIRYTDSKGNSDYYSADGTALKKAFFRTPVKFTRISSGFSKSRWHPVLKRARAHNGVDYAAPRGTPIIATGDAIVEFRGWKGGYGRVVYLKHGRKYRTVYGHMSRFAKGLETGDRVSQGQIIGYVGKSGLATGPHLHYEFHVNGVRRNPLTVTAAAVGPLPPKEMVRFESFAKPVLASLERTSSDTMLADAR